ncbi:MAG: CHRD domain-containing protein [Planctomycetota bacterium]|jgi:hypothetical protein
MRSSLSLLAGALLTLSAIPAQVIYLSASLDGAQEVPPMMSPGTGWGLVRVDQATASVNVFVQSQGLVGTMAHLHNGAVGINGPVIIPLNQGPAGRWTGSAVVSAVDLNVILGGNSYLNIHTAARPAGEIRGQAVYPTNRRFTGHLLGANVVPPSPSAATGSLVTYLHEPDGVAVYELTVTGMVGTGARINIGPPGMSGPILAPLVGTGGTRWCGVFRGVKGQVLNDLLAGNLFVDVTSAAFPGGEIRSQVLADHGDFFAFMDGFQEVPPVITPAIGQATVSLRPDRRLDYDVQTVGLFGATAAHIHSAPPGINGPVAHGLVGGPMAWMGTTNPLTPLEVAQLNSAMLYVNAHTGINPGGEIRGQLFPGNIPTTYGAGCPDVAGNLAEIGSIGLPSMGTSFQVTLRAATPNTAAVCLFGRNRDVIGGTSLPADLAILAMPGCFLLHNTQLTNLSQSATTDADGCATASVFVPLSPSVIGFTGQAQWYIIDPLSPSPIPLVNSNALEFVVQ